MADSSDTAWPATEEALTVLDALLEPRQAALAEAPLATGFAVLRQTELIASPAVVHQLASPWFQKALTAHQSERPRTVPPGLWEDWRLHDPWRRRARDGAPLVLDVCTRGAVGGDRPPAPDAQQVGLTWTRRIGQLAQGLQGQQNAVEYGRAEGLGGQPSLGRLYARHSASAQSLPRFVRPLVFGAYREVDQRNAMGRILVQIAMRELAVYRGDPPRFAREFPTLWRYGGTDGGRDAIVGEVQAALQARVDPLVAAGGDAAPSAATLGWLTQLKPPHLILEEERARAWSSFGVSRALCKQHCIAMVLRRGPPAGALDVPVLGALYAEGQRLHHALVALAAAVPEDHWVRRTLEVAQEHVRRLQAGRHHRDPPNPESGLPHSRHRDERSAHVSLYDNLKGSFLSRLYQEVEVRVTLCAAAYLRAVVRRFNATAPAALPDTFPLIHDGLLVPFVPSPALLRATEAYVEQRLGGGYRPHLESKQPEPTPQTEQLRSLLATAVVRADRARLTAVDLSHRQRYELGRFAFARLVLERDHAWQRGDGSARTPPLGVREFLLARYRRNSHLPGLRTYLDQRAQQREAPCLGDYASVPEDGEVEAGLQDARLGLGEAGAHLVPFFEMSWWFSQIFFQVRNPPQSDRPFLELLAEGRWQFRSEQDLLRDHGQWKCRPPARAGGEGVAFVRQWLTFKGHNPWGVRWVTLVQQAPGPGRPPIELEVEPCWDPRRQELVFNEFQWPRCDYLASHWRCRHLATAELEAQPAWRWWCHFIAHLFVEPELMGYWHRYWAHTLQCPDDAPAAFLYLYSEQQGCGKGIAMRVVQGLLGQALWYGGAGAHRRVLRNDGGETEGRRKRLLFLDEASRLSKSEYDVLTGLCDNARQNHRQLYQDAVMVRTAARIVLLSNDDDVLPPRNEHIRRLAALGCSEVWRQRAHPANFAGLLEGMRATIGLSRDPECLCEEALAVIAECYRRLELGAWLPENVPPTLFGSVVQYGPQLYRFLCTLAVVRYVYDGTTQAVDEHRLGPSAAEAYPLPWADLHQAYRHWGRLQQRRGQGLLGAEDFRLRALRLGEGVLGDALHPRLEDPRTVTVWPERLRAHLRSRADSPVGCGHRECAGGRLCAWTEFEAPLARYCWAPRKP